MLAGAADVDKIRAGADHFGQCRFVIKRLAELVEIGDRQLGAAFHFAAVGRQFAQNDLHQRRFAGAVGADQADAVAALHDRAEIQYHRLVAERFGDTDQFGDDLASALHIADREFDIARALAPRRALVAQGVRARHAALAARAPSLEAIADPDVLLLSHLVLTA